MSFSEKLRKLREEKRMSQEELAEMLDVSRQAVSKWEQGMGYPEVEKLLLLSGKLGVSLDDLMFDENANKTHAEKSSVTGTIVITSPNEHVIVTCSKVATSPQMRGRKNSPQYALFGVGNAESSFWGEPTTFLGWYADQEMLSKELDQIHKAILKGTPAYTLQYSAKTRRRWARVEIVKD